MSLTWSPSAASLTLYREHSPVVFNDYPVSRHEGHMIECASPREDSGKNYQQVRADTELLVDENKCFSFLSGALLSRCCRKSIIILNQKIYKT